MSAAPPPLRKTTPADVPGRIGAYEVRGVIGTGSMGVVYLGHDPVINRPVAIKTIQRHLLEAGTQQGAAARFRVEAQAAGRLSHPHIVSVYQFGQDEDNAYIVMEYVDGHSVADYLRRPERLAREEVLCLMVQLLEALHYAHEAGVVHRDIKPANLMVDRDGRLKITDFGIARTESSQVTRANTVVGSPGYMAPEQYTGGPLDRRVDVFAAGVLLYKMLSGMTPFTGSDEAIMYQIVYGQHGQLSLRSGDASLTVFDGIIDAALAKSPTQRFASAQQFLDALHAVWPRTIPKRLAAMHLLPPRTIALEKPVPTQPAGATPRASPTAPSPGFVNSVLPSSLPVPTGWDETELAGLERELTRYVGPVAKVLVRRAARGQTDVGEVRRLVASAIVDAEVRERFLTATDGNGKPAFRESAIPSRFADSQLPTARDGTPLRPDDVDKAGAALAQSMGPIGLVLARRCANGATTREQFVSRIVAQLAARIDVNTVETELWRCLN